MGACASFPKVMKEKDRAAPPPEQPKEEVETATTSAADVAEGEKEIKVDNKAEEDDEKTLGTFLEEEKKEETTTTMTEEEKSVATEEPIKDSPVLVEAKEESPVPIDSNTEITKVDNEKK